MLLLYPSGRLEWPSLPFREARMALFTPQGGYIHPHTPQGGYIHPSIPLREAIYTPQEGYIHPSGRLCTPLREARYTPPIPPQGGIPLYICLPTTRL